MECDEDCQAQLELASSDSRAALLSTWNLLVPVLDSAFGGNHERIENVNKFNSSMQTIAAILKQVPAEHQVNMTALAEMPCSTTDAEAAKICNEMKFYFAKILARHPLGPRSLDDMNSMLFHP